MSTARSKIRSFRDLEVWKLGMEIVKDIYEVTKSFPREELYGLVAQMRKAAVSIPSNIAEGFNRHGDGEYRRFLFIALGSCGELETQVEVGCLLRYMNQEDRARLVEKLDREGRMLRTLISRIEERGL